MYVCCSGVARQYKVTEICKFALLSSLLFRSNLLIYFADKLSMILICLRLEPKATARNILQLSEN